MQDIWTGLNNYAQIDHGCFQSVSTRIQKVDTLANTKKQRYIQSPVKHLIRSSSGESVRLLNPHIRWGHLVFATVNQVKIFSRNITHSVNWIRLTECATFQMTQCIKVKSWTTDITKTLVIEHKLKRNNSLSILIEKFSLMLRQLDCCLGWLS